MRNLAQRHWKTALPLLSGGDGSADPGSVAVDGAYAAVQDALFYEFGVFRGRAAVVGRQWRSDGGADRICRVWECGLVELVDPSRKVSEGGVACISGHSTIPLPHPIRSDPGARCTASFLCPFLRADAVGKVYPVPLERMDAQRSARRGENLSGGDGFVRGGGLSRDGSGSLGSREGCASELL